MGIDLPDVPRLVQGERRMTYRIPPWLPEKLHRWDRTLGPVSVFGWLFGAWSLVCTAAWMLAGYGEASDHDFAVVVSFLIAVASFMLPLYRGGKIKAVRVGMGARMAQLVDVGVMSWVRLPPDEQEASEAVVRQLFAAANRHDRNAARERVITLVELERTCVVSARGADGRMILDDVQHTILGRHAVNGQD